MGRKKKSPPPSFATAGTWHTHYVVLFDDLLNSPAYIALSAAAKEAYTILMQEYKGIYTGDKIICSKYMGTDVKVDGEQYTIVKQSDIVAIVED